MYIHISAATLLVDTRFPLTAGSQEDGERNTFHNSIRGRLQCQYVSTTTGPNSVPALPQEASKGCDEQGTAHFYGVDNPHAGHIGFGSSSQAGPLLTSMHSATANNLVKAATKLGKFASTFTLSMLPRGNYEPKSSD